MYFSNSCFCFCHHCLCFRAHSCYFLSESLEAFSYVDSLPLVVSPSMHSPHRSQITFSKHRSTYIDPLLSSHLMIPQSFQDESKLPNMTPQGPSWSVLHFHFHTNTFFSPGICHAVLSLLANNYGAPTIWNALPLLLSSRQGSFSSSITWSLSGKTPSFFLICSSLLPCAPLSEVFSLVCLPQETLRSFKVQ